jgi:chitosanase
MASEAERGCPAMRVAAAGTTTSGAADDPLMREVQDEFFDDTYWEPAEQEAVRRGIGTALGTAVVYDGHVHGSWDLIRRRTVQAIGTVQQAGEEVWISAYVAKRREWLATHSRADLRATVYRMTAFRDLIELGAWDLPLPLVVRGIEISAASLSALPPNVYDGPRPRSRKLKLNTPIQRGRDVRLLQLMLSAPARGERIKADAAFGQVTHAAVRRLQAAQGLPVTGVVDDRVFDLLEL